MVRAARWFVAHVAPKLVFLRDVYPEYKVRLLGHSLGAGVATLACLLLRSHDQLSDIECIAFAPPACISSELAGDASACVTSIVNRDDLLSYMSYQTTRQHHVDAHAVQSRKPVSWQAAKGCLDDKIKINFAQQRTKMFLSLCRTCDMCAFCNS